MRLSASMNILKGFISKYITIRDKSVYLKMLCKFFLVIISLFFLIIQSPMVLASAPTGFLKVSGQNILNEKNQQIFLRGINLHTFYYQYIWDKDAPLASANQNDIKYLKTLGVTAIRLGLHWKYFQTSGTGSFEQTLGVKLIDNYVRWCEQAHIYLILDMHIVPPEEDVQEGKIWTDPESKQYLVDLWKQIAYRYANKTIIAGYDIYNEPNPIDTEDWWSLANDVIQQIRQVDKKHLLFIEFPMNGEPDFRKLADKNIVYSYHDYTPFIVSHAGVNWTHDSPVPSDYYYPGKVLKEFTWQAWAKDAIPIKRKLSTWQKVSSGVMTVPKGVEFATVKLSGFGNVGEVWFDDINLTHNQVNFPVWNSTMENKSILDSHTPANWYFWGSENFTGTWSQKNRLSTKLGDKWSLKIKNTTNSGLGVWAQATQFYTKPLVAVKANDKINVQGWIYAPSYQSGEIGISVDYLKGSYETYDPSKLKLNSDIEPYLTWSKANNVPLYVGEFGAISSAPGNSRYNLISDKISIMNTAGLHWSLWSYRDFVMPNVKEPYFGLYVNQIRDNKLAKVLKKGLQ